eukprot:TRINITY_DN8971_c0_g1_i1.p1 TRINITY_DN8971_c0_g1~~TRINITY_DN8971_c0_g1_i1.p1  ORF type:complete len:243 (-),score=48.71 TRINITY_DN8971_c0_g1_i1:341-1069(-)
MSNPNENAPDPGKMLNVYMVDYLKKQGFTQTAEIFQQEAGLVDCTPRIDIPESFIFEWWYVFWDVFFARNENMVRYASPEAIDYVKFSKERKMNNPQKNASQQTSERQYHSSTAPGAPYTPQHDFHMRSNIVMKGKVVPTGVPNAAGRYVGSPQPGGPVRYHPPTPTGAPMTPTSPSPMNEVMSNNLQGATPDEHYTSRNPIEMSGNMYARAGQRGQPMQYGAPTWKMNPGAYRGVRPGLVL